MMGEGNGILTHALPRGNGVGAYDPSTTTVILKNAAGAAPRPECANVMAASATPSHQETSQDDPPVPRAKHRGDRTSIDSKQAGRLHVAAASAS